MKLGSTVTLNVKGTTDDGMVFADSAVSGPMVFQTGMEMAMDGLENNILDMEGVVGEKASFVVSQYDAYGEYLEDKVEKIPTERIPMRNLKVGKRVWIGNDEGAPEPCTVLEIHDSYVLFDMNHPLAGHDLHFEVEILDFQDAPEDFISVKEKERQEGQYKEAYTVQGIGDRPQA